MRCEPKLYPAGGGMSFLGRALRLSDWSDGWRAVAERIRAADGVRTDYDGFTPPPGHGVSDGVADLGPKVETPGAPKKGDEVEQPVERDPSPDVATEEVPIEV